MILTSNVGSQWIQEMAGRKESEIRAGVMEELRHVFRPEFLNRLDEIILFRSLGRESLARIVDIMVREVNDRLADRKITVELTARRQGCGSRRTARADLRRAPAASGIQKHLQDPLAIRIHNGRVPGRRQGDDRRRREGRVHVPGGRIRSFAGGRARVP